MTRDQVLIEVRQALEVVPAWLENIPDHELMEVWTAIRQLLLEGVRLSPREKGMVCMAVGTALRCQPLVSLGAAVARGAGNSPSDVLEARRVAEIASGFGGYFGEDGSFDYYRFEKDMLQTASSLRTAMNIA